MGRKPNNFNQIVHILQELHTMYPSYTMGMHLSTALDGYRDFWGITDREFVFALQKYKAKLEMDAPYTEGEELEKIISDGLSLKGINSILDEEEQEEY